MVTDDLEERVRWAAYLRPRIGRPVSCDELASGLVADAAAVRFALDVLAHRGAVELDRTGAVIGSGGLTLSQTVHRLRLNGVELHTWCALDAVGIPAALEIDADITTRCGWCSQPLILCAEHGVVPSDNALVLWLPKGPCTNVREEFCPLANLFCNREHLASWRSESDHVTGQALTVSEAGELGRSWWGPADTCCDRPPFR